MRNFDTVKRGYDQDQVKFYLDEVISEYEKLLNAKKESDRKVLELSERLQYFKQLENTMNRAIFSAETTEDDADRLKRNINLLKRRLKSIIEGQLEIIEEMDKIEFERDEY